MLLGRTEVVFLACRVLPPYPPPKSDGSSGNKPFAGRRNSGPEGAVSRPQ